MVYAENEKPLADGHIYFSYKHSLQMGSRSPRLSLVGNLEARAVEKEPCSSGAEENSQTQFEDRCAYGLPLDANRKDPRGAGDLAYSGYMYINNSDKESCCLSDMRSDFGKRHNSSDDLHAVMFKRARPDNYSCDSTSQLRDGEADVMADEHLGREAQLCSTEPVSKTIITNGVDDRDVSGVGISCVSNSRSNTTGISLHKPNDIGFVLPELPSELAFPAQFIERSLLSNESNHGEGTPLPFYDNYFRKPALVGPNHQVDVPTVGSQNPKCSNKYVGTCIIPMPDADTLSSSSVNVAKDMCDCSCPDQGSIRCVRQHVTEAREHAKIAFGLEKFAQLGFFDMGEDVAKKWTVEEEQLFHEVIFGNPVSAGKNFWNVLSRFFTTRNSKELVSYYFNVFMLRKRAEQNRLDPCNADSDNDEWQDGDDGHYSMDGARECPYSSSIYRDNAYVSDHEDQEGSSEEDDDKETCDDFDVASESTEHGPFNLCNGCIDSDNEDDSDKETYEHFATDSGSNESREFGLPNRSMISYKSGFIPSAPTTKRNSDDMDDSDVHDDPHASFDGHHRGVYSSSKHTSVSTASESGDLSICKNVDESRTSLNIASEHGYLSGPCDSKTWDVGYFAGSGKVVEFLPTCYVIEEVFGKGNCDNDAKDGPSIR